MDGVDLDALVEGPATYASMDERCLQAVPSSGNLLPHAIAHLYRDCWLFSFTRSRRSKSHIRVGQ